MAARPVFSRARRADCLREGSVIQRRTFLVGGGTMLLVLPLPAEAQHQTGKLPRIGWLTSSVVHPRNVDAFREGMRALGYRDVSMEFRAAAGQMDRLPALAAELLALNVEVIVTDGGPAAVAEMRDAEEIERAFSGARRSRATAMLTVADAFLWSERARIVALAAQHRLPSMYPEEEFVEAGGLMAYGPHVPDNFRRTAGYVDKILRGAKPADLPVEQPTKYKLVINLKTAKALGLKIPPSLLQRADEVIQ